jgi:hypothetical protein
LNLGSLPLFFIIYFAKLFLSIITRFFYLLTGKKRCVKVFLDYIEDGTYFGDILGLFIDGYIDLLITAYYN